MNHAIRFLIKMVINGIILVPFLMWFTEATWLSSIVAALGLTIIAYIVGDQLILRATNNVIATVADALIAAVYLWSLAYYFNWSLSMGEMFLTVACIAIGELFYHGFLGLYDPEKQRNA